MYFRLIQAIIFYPFLASHISFITAIMIRIIPLTHEILNRNFFAILLPSHAPSITAIASTIKALITTAHPLTFTKAAPKPTAIPSNDKASDKDAASLGDITFELSTSAASGSAYKFNTKRKLHNEKL